MKPLVIYHADCTDGYGAAFAAWLKLGDEAEYLPMQYGAKNYEFPNLNRDVYIIDFSFPRSTMEYLFSTAKRVVWLDHHATSRPYAEDKCGGYIGSRTERHSRTYDIVHDNNKSGALLAWEYFHPGTEVPMLIRHIDDRDRWQFKLEGSKELHAALSSYKPWSFAQWRDECSMLNDYGDGMEFNDFAFTKRLKEEGSAILRAQEQHVQQMVNHARKCAIKSWDDEGKLFYNGLAVNASLHQSEVGDELANQSGTFGLIWYVDSGTRVRCSLRSNGDYDVSGIARAFGGGGHRTAAGFETDVTTLMGWLK